MVEMFIIQQMSPIKRLFWPRKAAGSVQRIRLRPTHIESSGQAKAHPNFFKPTWKFDIKIVSPKDTTWNKQVFYPNMVHYKALGPDLMKPNDFFGPTFLEFRPALAMGPKYKVRYSSTSEYIQDEKANYLYIS
jgi:hypothetical protein